LSYFFDAYKYVFRGRHLVVVIVIVIVVDVVVVVPVKYFSRYY